MNTINNNKSYPRIQSIRQHNSSDRAPKRAQTITKEAAIGSQLLHPALKPVPPKHRMVGIDIRAATGQPHQKHQWKVDHRVVLDERQDRPDCEEKRLEKG